MPLDLRAVTGMRKEIKRREENFGILKQLGEAGEEGEGDRGGEVLSQK
jgi:hypothetical protein